MDELVVVVVAVFLVYFVLALVFAWVYETLVRRSILSSVRQAGGELIRIERMRARYHARKGKGQSQRNGDGASKPRYVVRYRTPRGEEFTRLCTLSLSGHVAWYDEG
ncbi:MAG: hypothetical protein RRC07_04390 [Anaerolineae bacterium]|nr:hypothetical protein [Anaerolineae bacterium]